MVAAPEFSRLLEVGTITPDRERREKVEATAEECAALARRFDLRSLSGLKGNLTILRISEGKLIRVRGDMEADVVQSCVVSLQDVPARIQIPFDTSFTEDGEEVFDADMEFDLELEEDPHEVMYNGIIDMGELVAQYLSLELDPYPRAPGVSLAAQLAETGTAPKNRPFQVLQGLKSEKDE
ncbi:MAG: DUF177 domain-containing protein [Proteobacteria bacterium]|nr:DUF177 domain-containing protein [Pseudomonadota bacterium]